MVNKYVLDACALMAFVCDEKGANIIEDVLSEANDGTSIVYMNKLNFFEVYYNIRRAEGDQKSEDFYNTVMKLPITIISEFSDEVFHEAGRIKSRYKMSLADSIALAEASIMGASILTSDHHEFDIVEKNEKIKFCWIR